MTRAVYTRLGAVSSAVLALALAAAAAGVSVAGQDASIPATEAATHLGETRTVCGHVASAAYLASVGGQPTFLNFERPYPDQVFTVVIWGSARKSFDGRPENTYDGRSVCVSGKIVEYRGTPQIVVESPDQIEVMEEFGGDELGDLERVFVKAVLASVGYDVNYGSGEWDEEAVEAVIAFQEDAGLEPTGEPDPGTLRALAEAAEGMDAADRDLVIRLLLFELARRQE